MTTRTGGQRAKTRYKLRKKPRNSGKISTTAFMQEFKIGDTVMLKPEPAVHKGMPHPKYMGRTGKVIEKQGKCYMVEFNDGSKVKHTISAPVHLKRI